MEFLNSESLSRHQEHERLSLLYQQDLEQWLTRLDRQKVIWEKKRNNLSKRCTELQESVQNVYSSSNLKLNQEKEKYRNVITKLMPEWQKAIERKQMKDISEFENKVCLIQQRRHSAGIAFEKEKKLLSLISIRQKQIQKLQDEEKEEALIREQQRCAIIQNENEYNDKLRLSKSQSFADIRLQEYIMRKSVTSDLEKKFNHQMDEIKTKLSQNELIDVDELKPMGNHTLKSKVLIDKDLNVDHQEEKHDDVKNEEGNETQPLTKDLNAEQLNSHNVHMNEYQNENASMSTDVNTLHFMQNIKQSDDQRASDEESDTSKIEQAVGLIQVKHNEPSDPVISEKQNEEKPCTVPPTNEIQKEKIMNRKETKQHSQPEEEQQVIAIQNTQTNMKVNEIKKKSPDARSKSTTKLKRAFRAKTSKNRLQFSLLGMVSPNKTDQQIAINQHEPTNAEQANKNKKPNDPKVAVSIVEHIPL